MPASMSTTYTVTNQWTFITIAAPFQYDSTATHTTKKPTHLRWPSRGFQGVIIEVTPWKPQGFQLSHLAKRFNALIDFTGGLAAPFPNTATVKSNFLVLKLEKCCPHGLWGFVFARLFTVQGEREINVRNKRYRSSSKMLSSCLADFIWITPHKKFVIYRFDKSRFLSSTKKELNT